MVLDSVGVPVAGIGLIFGVDRVLDMSRTAVNVTGDLVVAAVMDRHLSHGILTAAGTPARAEASQRG
jgi:Na+/H+-dicarboxylate symporter